MLQCSKVRTAVGEEHVKIGADVNPLLLLYLCSKDQVFRPLTDRNLAYYEPPAGGLTADRSVDIFQAVLITGLERGT